MKTKLVIHLDNGNVRSITANQELEYIIVDHSDHDDEGAPATSGILSEDQIKTDLDLKNETHLYE